MTEKGQISNGASERVLMYGNEALGEAAIIAGCDAYFGYQHYRDWCRFAIYSKLTRAYEFENYRNLFSHQSA